MNAAAVLVVTYSTFYQFDPNGVMQRSWPVPGNACLRDVYADETGVYIGGSSKTAMEMCESDAFVAKYTFGGTLLWRSDFGSPAADTAQRIVGDARGIYVSGYTFGALPGHTGAGDRDAFVRHYDRNGVEIWTRQFGTGGSEGARGLAIDHSGLYVCGMTSAIFPGQASAGGDDLYLRKYDTSGNEVWTLQFGTPIHDWTEGMARSGCDTYAVAATPLNGRGVMLAKLTGGCASLDSTPPVTAHSLSAPANASGWHNRPVVATLTADDGGGSGVAEVRYSVNGAAYVSSSSPAASVTLTEEGVTTVRYHAVDRAGNHGADQQIVIRIDRTPPVISGMPASGCVLWPPNGQMVEVASVVATDARSGIAAPLTLNVRSNEPSSAQQPDSVVAGSGNEPRKVFVRAARSGTGQDRVYDFSASVADLAGNAAVAAAKCAVPHDLGNPK